MARNKRVILDFISIESSSHEMYYKHNQVPKKKKKQLENYILSMIMIWNCSILHTFRCAVSEWQSTLEVSFLIKHFFFKMWADKPSSRTLRTAQNTPTRAKQLKCAPCLTALTFRHCFRTAKGRRQNSWLRLRLTWSYTVSSLSLDSSVLATTQGHLWPKPSNTGLSEQWCSLCTNCSLLSNIGSSEWGCFLSLTAP